jgi:hypothetical protein
MGLFPGGIGRLGALPFIRLKQTIYLDYPQGNWILAIHLPKELERARVKSSERLLELLNPISSIDLRTYAGPSQGLVESASPRS